MLILYKYFITARLHDLLRVKQSLHTCSPLILQTFPRNLIKAASSRYRSDYYINDIFSFDVMKHDFFTV